MNEPDLTPLPNLSAPAPSRPRLLVRFWRFPGTRIVLYILTFGLCAFALSVSLIGLSKLFHVHRGHHPEVTAVVSESLVAASAVLAFWVMTRFADKRPWETAGFTRREMLPQTLLGFAVGAGLLSVVVGLLGGLGIYHVTGHGQMNFLALPLVLYLGVGIFEETFFRGYLFQTLETRWGSGVALISSAVVFGLAHLINPVHGVTPLERLAGPLFICLEAGLPLGAAYLLTRRWWLSIGIHWAWDFFEGPIYGLHDSGTVDPHTLLRSAVTGPFIATGGPFGPEASLIFLIMGTLLGLMLLRAAVKTGQWRPMPRRLPRAAFAQETDPPPAD